MIHSRLAFRVKLLPPLIVLGVIALIASGCGTETAESPADVKTGTVTVNVTWPDGKTETVLVPDVADGDSLESVMREIDSINLDISGSGTTAFVRSIAGTATSDSDGWTFTVDGEFAMKGIGSTVLHPPTNVKWKFGGFDSDAE